MSLYVSRLVCHFISYSDINMSLYYFTETCLQSNVSQSYCPIASDMFCM